MARTYRRRYSGSKRFVRSCRNHGSCDYCRNTRTYNIRRRRRAADVELAEFRKGKTKVGVDSLITV
jgi:hypothetical protein